MLFNLGAEARAAAVSVVNVVEPEPQKSHELERLIDAGNVSIPRMTMSLSLQRTLITL